MMMMPSPILLTYYILLLYPRTNVDKKAQPTQFGSYSQVFLKPEIVKDDTFNYQRLHNTVILLIIWRNNGGIFLNMHRGNCE